MGYEDVLRYGGELIASLKAEIGYDGREWDEYLEAMDADGQPTAYVFRCRRCRTLGGYSDFT